MSERMTANRSRSEAVVERATPFGPVLDALPGHIAILDEEGAIVAVNRAWKTFGVANGLLDPACGVGANYLSICEGVAGEGEE
jgi:hypothetical protein